MASMGEFSVEQGKGLLYSGRGDGEGVRVGEGTALVVVEITAGEGLPLAIAVVVTLGSSEIPDGSRANTQHLQ